MSSTSTITESHAPPAKQDLISPNALCHVVLRTTVGNYERMVRFYVTILGSKITHNTHRLSFLTYDYEHHRIAILIDPTAHPRGADGPQVGLHHMGFGFPTLHDLVTSYEQKKFLGIRPAWCVNHGMSTSMYYADPDGNELEFQVDNFDTDQESVDFTASPKFEKNPVGVDFDPEQFVERCLSGEGEWSIMARPKIGRRDRR